MNIGVSTDGTSRTYGPQRCAIDIGTGASCIFPLLGHKNFGWHWIASEIVEDSITSARNNISMNSLEEFIEVREMQKEHIFEGTSFASTIGVLYFSAFLFVGPFDKNC